MYCHFTYSEKIKIIGGKSLRVFFLFSLKELQLPLHCFFKLINYLCSWLCARPRVACCPSCPTLPPSPCAHVDPVSPVLPLWPLVTLQWSWRPLSSTGDLVLPDLLPSSEPSRWHLRPSTVSDCLSTLTTTWNYLVLPLSVTPLWGIVFTRSPRLKILLFSIQNTQNSIQNTNRIQNTK